MPKDSLNRLSTNSLLSEILYQHNDLVIIINYIMSKSTNIFEVVGKKVDDAKTFLEAAGYLLRVVREDGQDFGVTLDYNTDRVNVQVNHGIVTIVNGMG